MMPPCLTNDDQHQYTTKNCCCKQLRRSKSRTSVFSLIVLITFIFASFAKIQASGSIHTKQLSDFLEGFEDHDESIPLRISYSKKPIVKHFRSRNKSSPIRDDKRTRKKRSRRRRRRSLHHVDEDEEFKFANYTLRAFGKTFNLHLTPYLDFISPHYTLEVIGKQDNESKKEDSSPKHCFYSGYVNGSLNNTATVSICNGLFGAFRSEDSEYLIQPAHDESSHEHSPKKHRVYRRSAGRRRENLFSVEDNKKQFCGTKTGTNVTMQNETEHTANDSINKTRSSTGSSTEPSKERKKRETIEEKTIEVMVTADYHMYLYHTDPQTYVLTLMAIVSSIYRHPSIENLVKIVVVKMMILRTEKENEPFDYPFAETQLQKFRSWQSERNEMSGPEHWDAAIFLTRKDLCTNGQNNSYNCDTLGIAKIRGLCNGINSAAIVEDGGLNAAFTIAHEIGHLLGAMHDEDKAHCYYETDHKVMSKTLDENTLPWTWSKCSSRLIGRFLNSKRADCLNNKPQYGAGVYSLPVEAAGRSYDLDQQCQMMYGQDAYTCDKESRNSECGNLWCNVRSTLKPGSWDCKTNYGKWASGTPCNTRNSNTFWCQQGKCVRRNFSPFPLAGGWSAWSRFGECSKPCGGGVKSSNRSCTSPRPRHGGDYCSGKRRKHRSCNTHKCPDRNHRHNQCETYVLEQRRLNNKGINYNINWVPYYPSYDQVDDFSACRLACQDANGDGRGTDLLNILSPKPYLTDGTPCYKDFDGVCVNGFCEMAGCDNILYSNTKLDRCGVCGGDNSTCVEVSGNYLRSGNTPGYKNLTVIPEGASELIIRQQSAQRGSDGNFLVLYDWNENFLLNADRGIQPEFQRIIKRKSTWERKDIIYNCTYSGTASVNEYIRCKGKITKKLHLAILLSGTLTDPNVYWTYFKPVENHYSWSEKWELCDYECHGRKKSYYVCEFNKVRAVDAKYCSRLQKPESKTQPCNTDCIFRSKAVPKTKCSSRCGQGMQKIHYLCYKISKNSEKSVDTRYCNPYRAPYMSNCRGRCLGLQWKYSKWGQCSRTCGTGAYRTRNATCEDVEGKVWNRNECASVLGRAVTRDQCSLPTCVQWIYGEWTPCMCKDHTQTRSKQCIKGGMVANNAYCDRLNSPVVMRTCLSYCWEYIPYDRCSNGCGIGVQAVVAACRKVTGEKVADKHCFNGGSTKKPLKKSRSCRGSFECPEINRNSNSPNIIVRPSINENNRKIQWRTGSWSKCDCSTGRRRRLVRCVESSKGVRLAAQSEDLCSYHDKPHDSENCQPDWCERNIFWSVSDWSQCSATCGRDAIKSRAVNCKRIVNSEVILIDSVHCSSLYRKTPSNTDICSGLPSCPKALEWNLGSWGPCSQTCGKGKQYRSVWCSGAVGACSNLQKPSSTRSCSLMPCPKWRTGVWGECNQTCGGGRKTREVYCYDRHEKVHVEESLCNMLWKPDSVRTCNLKKCRPAIRWRKLPWGLCSKTCGKGQKTRQVYCAYNNETRVEERLCAGVKPKHIKSCKHNRAKKCPRWRTGQWSMCPSSCDHAVQKRAVSCRYRQRIIEQNNCNIYAKPIDTQDCPLIKSCSAFRWNLSNWTDCSKSCGAGVSSRRTRCVQEVTRRAVDDSYCTEERPITQRNCSNGPCHATWKKGAWTECTLACGEGRQLRDTWCSYIDMETYQEIKTSSCVQPGPATVRECNRGDCKSKWLWKTGDWGQCSKSCGMGASRRQVVCINQETQQPDEDGYCERDHKQFKPDKNKPCHGPPCRPKSCLELKQYHSDQAFEDGHYMLQVGTDMAQIYCHQMLTDAPEEFITLKSTENYSKFYAYSLTQDRPDCPASGQDRDLCHPGMCRDVPDAGLTRFQKVRFLIKQNIVKIDDFTFASSHGKHIGFGVAGDCYSSSNCPQGRFSISLEGTGFTISERTSWNKNGVSSSQLISRYKNNQQVTGRCGGYCGKCSPSAHGVILEYNPFLRER